ncbi:MAG: hypothetical protein PHS92_00275, partial [Candidatus Gracilibacteria bacterium]|nr:hypothetical protein [Candidatus Gracilibacteria bacterium]
EVLKVDSKNHMLQENEVSVVDLILEAIEVSRNLMSQEKVEEVLKVDSVDLSTNQGHQAQDEDLVVKEVLKVDSKNHMLQENEVSVVDLILEAIEVSRNLMSQEKVEEVKEKASMTETTSQLQKISIQGNLYSRKIRIQKDHIRRSRINHLSSIKKQEPIIGSCFFIFP